MEEIERKTRGDKDNFYTFSKEHLNLSIVPNDMYKIE